MFYYCYYCSWSNFQCFFVSYSIKECSLATDIYYIAIKNAGTNSLSYGVAVECGCGAEFTGEITSVAPGLSNIEGYDFVTITGKNIMTHYMLFNVLSIIIIIIILKKGRDFRPSTVRACSFGAEGETDAEYISPTQVRCLTPPQTSKVKNERLNE
jgi:hypothetical protein